MSPADFIQLANGRGLYVAVQVAAMTGVPLSTVQRWTLDRLKIQRLVRAASATGR